MDQTKIFVIECFLAVRMDLTKIFLNGFLAVRMDLMKIFLKGFRRRAKKIEKKTKCVSNDRSRHDDSNEYRIIKNGAILEG